MKTKSIYSFLFILVVLFTTSCIEHEVIPPPVNTVDLNCHFVGFVNGTQVEFTQNVQGYGEALSITLKTSILHPPYLIKPMGQN